MNNIVTFGEVIIRLSPKNNLKMRQADSVDLIFGGTELNVASSLSILGETVIPVSVVKNDFTGDAAIASMQRNGLITDHIKRNDFPIGLYYLEVGSGPRASRISYNRLQASFANIDPNTIHWVEILKEAKFFHWTGITPGISRNSYETLKKGISIAQSKGVIITADPAYRSNLWKYGKDGHEVLKELVSSSTIFIGGVNEINEILGTDYSFDKDGFIEASKRLIKECPSIEKVFDKVRTGLSASWQKIYGRAWTGNEYITTEEFEVRDVIDRIGTGDAYAAGLIYGLQHFDDEKALRFANAACALKHTIYGDINLASKDEIIELMEGNTGGRIKR